MQRAYQWYFGLLGVAVLVSGLLEILAAAAGHTFAWPGVVFSGEAFRGIWGGLVMVFAGVFLLAGIRDFGEVHHLAKILIGSILLWIMAGTDLFGLLAAAVPGTEPGRWLNTLSEFLQAVTPPYTSAVVLLPFSLAIIPCLRRFQNTHPDVSR